MTKRSLAAPTKVLFIGNSFTARNNVPDLVAQLAESRGKRLQHRLISAGGASLRMHWNKRMFNIAPGNNGRLDGEGDLAVETHFHPVGTP